MSDTNKKVLHGVLITVRSRGLRTDSEESKLCREKHGENLNKIFNK